MIWTVAGHIGWLVLLSKFLAFLSDCTTATDCPNNGTNYMCINELCDCLPEHVLDGDDCVGMLPHCHFSIIFEFIDFILF